MKTVSFQAKKVEKKNTRNARMAPKNLHKRLFKTNGQTNFFRNPEKALIPRMEG